MKKFACLVIALSFAISSNADDKKEEQERRDRLIRRFDLDGDGNISDSEKKRMEKTLKKEAREADRKDKDEEGDEKIEKRARERAHQGIKKFDKDGDKALSVEEFNNISPWIKHAAWMKKYDKNKDGKYQEDELVEINKAMMEWQKNQRRGRRGRGGRNGKGKKGNAP